MPFPLDKVPACNVAVKPATPVDEMLAPCVYATPFPPLYGTVAVPLYGLLTKAKAEKVTEEQFNELTTGETAAAPVY